MSTMLEVGAIDELPNENGMFTEAYVLNPQTGFTHEHVVEILKVMGLTLDITAFESLSESLKRHFVVISRDGGRQPYGSGRRRNRPNK